MAASGNYIVESDVDNWLTAITATEDFATTDVDTTENWISGLVNNIATCTEIQFSSTGEVPAPLETGVVYYAINVDATHIRIAETPVLAAVPTPIDLTDQGSGTHTLDIGSGSSTVERQEVIDRAEQLIERITKDFFYSKVLAMYFDGNGSNKLFLNLNPDLLTITEILIAGIELNSSWWTFDKDTIYLNPEAVTGAGADLAELLYRLGETEALFPKGMGNIKITGTYGWSVCPVAIKRATIILCRYENDNTLFSTHSGNLKSEKLGDYAYTLSDAVNAKEFTGIDEVDKLLKHYIRKKPMLGVA